MRETVTTIKSQFNVNLAEKKRVCAASRLAGLFFLVAFFTQILTISAIAQLRDWRTFTNTRAVNQIIAHDDLLFAATTGGLLVFDHQTGSFETLTNADGLGGNNITAVTADRNGTIWAALSDGKVNLFEPETGEIELLVFDQQRSFTINDFYAVGDTMYIAFDFGVGEYRLDRNELKEIYQQLGLGFSPGVAATALLLHNQALYVGTAQGLATASMSIPNLKAPQSWTNLTSSDGLPTGEVTGLTVLDGKVVVATTTGIAIQENDDWTVVSNNLPDQTIKALAVSGTTLFAATPFAVFQSDDLVNWNRLDGFPGEPNDLVVTDGRVWGASKNSGLAEYEAEQNSWIVHEPNSPKTASFSSLAVDQNGTLWATSPIDGFLSFDGEIWQNYDELGSTARGDYRSVVIDDSGRVWLGVWGRGVQVLQPGGGTLQIAGYDTTGGLLAGIPNDLGYVVVNEVTKDRHGNIWLSNLGAATNRKLVAVTPEGEWVYFTPPNASRIEINRIIVDQFDQIWYGMSNDGVEVIDYRRTLFDPTDDVLTFGNTVSAQLASNRITGLAEDADGTIWIGTNDGLFFWFANQISRQFRLISNDVTVVRIDPSNNKWIGTSSGITIISSDNASLSYYTTENSPLVSNIITDFAFNPETGEAYIATTNGLSVVATPFTTLRQDFSQLSGYPNPLILDGGDAQFTITNLVRQSSVSIFTEDGRLIKAFPPGSISGAQATWDGRNENGDFVPSGIYLFVAQNSDGSASAAGKVAVVRR